MSLLKTLKHFFRDQLETVNIEAFTDDASLVTVLLSSGYKPFLPNVVSPTDTEYNLANLVCLHFSKVCLDASGLMQSRMVNN